MNGYFYDIETYSNILSFTFIPISKEFPLKEYILADKNKDLETKAKILTKIKCRIFIIHEQKNDLKELCAFVRSIAILVGYNNRNFDDNVLDYICINENKFSLMDTSILLMTVYTFVQEIFNNMFNRYQSYTFKKYVQPYRSVDLFKILRLDFSHTSLKQVAVNMNWYRIQDLPLSPYELVKTEDIPKLIDYNINDVLITRELYFKELEEVVQRFNATSLYNNDFLASSRSAMANRIMSKLYCEKARIELWELRDISTTTVINISLNKVIVPHLEFKTPELQGFLNKLKNTNVNVFSNKFSETIIFNGTSYSVATGGLHSNDRPGIFKSDDNFVYIDVDVTSYYPTIILNTKAAPRHLDQDIFLSLFRTLVEERIAYKKAGNSLADIYKIVINSLYGSLGQDTGWLYDLEALYKVTINGQLFLLYLAELGSVKGFRVVSANTDGLLFKVPVDRISEFEEVCAKWSAETNYNLEFTRFSKYIRLSVNHYIAITEEGTKSKGFFNTKFQPGRGFNMPILAKALIAYFLDGITPEDFIYNHSDIYDFCASIKTGEQFSKELISVQNRQVVKESLPKTIRYYCSSDGASLIKRYTGSDKFIKMLKGRKITMFNDYFEPPYNIEHKFYIKQVYDLIYAISNVLHKSIIGTKSKNKVNGISKSGFTGKMFDDLPSFENDLNFIDTGTGATISYLTNYIEDETDY